jgi:hypothetical protein
MASISFRVEGFRRECRIVGRGGQCQMHFRGPAPQYRGGLEKAPTWSRADSAACGNGMRAQFS